MQEEGYSGTKRLQEKDMSKRERVWRNERKDATKIATAKRQTRDWLARAQLPQGAPVPALWQHAGGQRTA